MDQRDRLAHRRTLDYCGEVKFVRALTLLCFSFGLFVQVAAQAAVPQTESTEMADCAEMAEMMPEQMDAAKEPSDTKGSCSGMTLECLVAMNCVPPLALSGDQASAIVHLPFPPLYLSATVVRLESEPLLPESPPPQIILSV